MAGRVISQARGPFSKSALQGPPSVRDAPGSSPVITATPLLYGGYTNVLVESAEFPRPADRTALLHIYRTGFQTVGNFLNSAMAYRPSLLVEAEQDTARHLIPSYPAFSAPPAAGQSLPMLATTSLRLSEEQFEVRTPAPSLHVFRTGFQTVQGLTLAQLHKPSLRVDETTYEVRSALPTLHAFRPGYATVGQPLAFMGGRPSTRVESETYPERLTQPSIHFFRTGFQTVAQPFAGNFRPATRVEAESYEVRSQPPYLHLFRTGFQTVGQPLMMLCGPRATRIDETDVFVARKAQRYPSSNPASTGGMPLPLFAYRHPRNHALYDGAQFIGAFTDWEAYQQAFNAPPVIPQYNPLGRMFRRPMEWKHHEPIVFVGAMPDWEKINTPSPDIATAVYDFQFLNGTFECHDLNGPEWQEQVRYYTNHARLMQAFRQFSTGASFASMQFDASASGGPKFCVEPEVWANDAADPAPPWTPDPADAGAWTPPASASGIWTPPSADTGVWADQSTPANTWDTQQRAC